MFAVQRSMPRLLITELWYTGLYHTAKPLHSCHPTVLYTICAGCAISCRIILLFR